MVKSRLCESEQHRFEQEAPLAVQGAAPAPGLFAFDKYSSAPIFTDAVRETASDPDSVRRLFVVPRAHVVRLHNSNGVINSIEVYVNGQQQFLPVTLIAWSF
jgi:hypothetical protein